MMRIRPRPAADAIPTRYSLLSRLKDWGDQESWKDFFETYWRLIYNFAVKSGLTDAEAQDVVQETVLCVAKDIEKFKRDRDLGSFKSWLRNMTHWRIADQLKKRGPVTLPRQASHDNVTAAEFREGLETIEEKSEAGLEALWEEEWQVNLFEAALARVRRQVKEEYYQMFDLYVLKEWPATKVARTLQTNIGQVYLAKHRVSSMIKKELRALEEKF